VNRDDLLVVADGVGGWAEVGIDPGLFSKALVKYIEEEFLKDPKGSLKTYLIEAVKRNKHVGSSTCCLAKFAD
jgi:protein phosphatase PTC7